MDAVSNVPPPLNEPVRAYAPGSAERAAVEAKIKELAASPVELTMAVGGQQRMGGGDRIAVVEPHNHAHVLGHLGNATERGCDPPRSRRRPRPRRAGGRGPSTTGPACS